MRKRSSKVESHTQVVRKGRGGRGYKKLIHSHQGKEVGASSYSLEGDTVKIAGIMWERTAQNMEAWRNLGEAYALNG